MSDPKKTSDAVVTPTEEEQEAVTGGALHTGRPPEGAHWAIEDQGKLHKLTRPQWNPGGPPEGF